MHTFRPINFIRLVIFLVFAISQSAFGGDVVFSIRTSTLGGNDLRTIYTDTYRQATHLRVSPDGQWIMFSRYNDKDPTDGLAKENIDGKNHYQNTELVLMRADGSELRVLIPPKKGVISVNSNWTDDGKGFVYLSNDNEKRVPEIRHAYLNSRMEITQITSVQLPIHLIPVDPHLHKGKLVFPAVDLRNMSRGLWIAQENGKNLRQLTIPTDPSTGNQIKHPSSGDNDPRFSPDGSRVAFMRLIEGKGLWSIYVVDVSSGKVTSLTKRHLSATQFDAVPEWSGDGKKLIFWSVDFKTVRFSITTVNPDGSQRSTVASDPYEFLQSPAFFPNTGSGPNARIAFSAWKVPKWKLRIRRLLGR
jgi:dipeptidyl aminopeptidase/acylaminoacyl peptidase